MVEARRTEPVEVTDVTEHAAELRAAWAAGRTPPAGRLLGLPELPAGDVWADIAGAVAVTGAASSTITGWLTRGGPKKAPFPAPRRLLYRLFWPLSELEEWNQQYQTAYK